MNAEDWEGLDAAALAPLVLFLRERIGDGLRSLVLFGSCLSARLRRPGSIPDFLAILDEGSLKSALPRLGCRTLTRCLASILPPLTLALRPDGQGAALAKLNLIEARTADDELARLPDLYLAGRLSKRTAVLYARNPSCQAELQRFCARAALAVAELTVLDLPRRFSLSTAVRACISLSYRAEVRPEGAQKWELLYDSFAAHYDEFFAAPLFAAAVAKGLRWDGQLGLFRDERTDSARGAGRAELLALVRRSRRRSVLRWPKQVLVYQGWLAYVGDKCRRLRQI
jgi:hypothetical protein